MASNDLSEMTDSLLEAGKTVTVEELNIQELKLADVKPVGKVIPFAPKTKTNVTESGDVKVETPGVKKPKSETTPVAKGNAKPKEAAVKVTGDQPSAVPEKAQVQKRDSGMTSKASLNKAEPKPKAPLNKGEPKPKAPLNKGEPKPKAPLNKAEPKPKGVGSSEDNKVEAGTANPTPKPKKKTPGKSQRNREDHWKRPHGNDENLVLESLNKLTLKEPSPITDFGDMGLKSDVLKAIHNYGLEKPAMCQQNVIVPLIEGRDLICQAQSGMGKTAAFCISILQRIDISCQTPQALILAPTRELAYQITDVCRAMGKRMGVITVSCVGQGERYNENKLKLLNGKTHIVVGTIGRLCHLLNDQDKPISQSGIRMFVMDEADKMIMDASFSRDLQYMINNLPGDAQFIVMSATMPPMALMRLERIMRNPFKFLVKNDQLTLDGIQQFYVNVGNEEHKMNTLSELFPLLNKSRGITFCNTRFKAKTVSRQMEIRGHVITGMVGSMDQEDRNNTLKNFKDGKILSLVASDLLGRGVDIQQVKLVINFDFPEKTEEYIHRIGRAGRYGRKGIAITFITDDQVEKLRKLEAFYHTKISIMPVNIEQLLEMTQ